MKVEATELCFNPLPHLSICLSLYMSIWLSDYPSWGGIPLLWWHAQNSLEKSILSFHHVVLGTEIRSLVWSQAHLPAKPFQQPPLDIFNVMNPPIFIKAFAFLGSVLSPRSVQASLTVWLSCLLVPLCWSGVQHFAHRISDSSQVWEFTIRNPFSLLASGICSWCS